MMPRPPRRTLFPYTTLFRSVPVRVVLHHQQVQFPRGLEQGAPARNGVGDPRRVLEARDDVQELDLPALRRLGPVAATQVVDIEAVVVETDARHARPRRAEGGGRADVR